MFQAMQDNCKAETWKGQLRKCSNGELLKYLKILGRGAETINNTDKFSVANSEGGC